MSEHSLPPDRSSWPKDPYLLLGVRRGVSPRDLRKAYLHLVRIHKPEHAPEEFQRIRAAYEWLINVTEMTASSEVADWSSPVDTVSSEPESHPPHGGDGPGSLSDPWERALRGELVEAYRDLSGAAGGGPAPEEVYLQLYWLLESSPRLDADRPAWDWLVRGLRDGGSGSARLRVLLTREAESDPTLAVGARFKMLLSPATPPGLLSNVSRCRWRAARVLARWDLIPEDLTSLRDWLPWSDEDLWARLLIDATSNMAWALGKERGRFRLLKKEAEEVAAQRLELADELVPTDHAEQATSGLIRIWSQHPFVPGLHDLLRLTWDTPTPAARSQLQAHLAEVAANPVGWFWRLDSLKTEASAALEMLMKLPDQLGVGVPSSIDSRDISSTSSDVIEFLASRRWRDYPSLRPDLLRFCLSEMVSPAAVALAARGRTELRLPAMQHLADVVASDWPLACVYRACEIVRG